MRARLVQARRVVGQAAHVLAVEPVFAAGEGLQQAGDVEEGGLARARGAGDGDELAFPDVQVERGPFLEQGGGTRAYVVEDGAAVLTPIRTGVSSLGAVEILVGLHVGDRVVVSGSDQFGDAPQVRITGE